MCRPLMLTKKHRCIKQRGLATPVNSRYYWKKVCCFFIFGAFSKKKTETETGAKVDAKATDGSTPLHKAAYGGHLPCIFLLLEWGAKISRQVC